MYKAPGATGAVGAGTASTLAYTGAGVTSWIVLAAVLIVLGLLALVAAKSRKRKIDSSK